MDAISRDMRNSLNHFYFSEPLNEIPEAKSLGKLLLRKKSCQKFLENLLLEET